MSCLKDDAIYIGRSDNGEGEDQYLPLKWGNRHGLVAGATGTGKTVTLQNLAEGFSNAGVPVFLSDIKGDLSGMCRESEMEDFLVKRAKLIGLLDEYEGQEFPLFSGTCSANKATLSAQRYPRSGLYCLHGC